jgi:hypothetical protein
MGNAKRNNEKGSDMSDMTDLVIAVVLWPVMFGISLLVPWILFEIIQRLIWAFKKWPLGKEQP